MLQQAKLTLDNGSKVGVVGGGPAGAFFAYFLLQMTQRMGISISVDVYERRDFAQFGPSGCNMCGGVISESLVQSLSIEGINLPPEIVQRGIGAFQFHTADETITLRAPFKEMRIATVYRGAGPKGSKAPWWKSFDGYLLDMAQKNGARVVSERVTNIDWQDLKPRIHTKDASQVYDLLVGAVGVNTPALELFEKLNIGYKSPGTKKTSNAEIELGSEYISRDLESAMHAFLLDLPKLDFAAIIPKGDYVTMCLIGDDITSEFVKTFTRNPVVSKYLARGGNEVVPACRCAPLASLGNAVHPFGDRVVILGDSGTARLNKDGIGSAYRVAKTAAVTALFEGISSEDFAKGYGKLCRVIQNDNRFGHLIFYVVGIIKKMPLLTRTVMSMARDEQHLPGKQRRMSRVLWDMFTGSAPYREVFFRCLHPAFLSKLVLHMIVRSKPTEFEKVPEEEVMDKSALGKDYKAGEVIVREGEIGDCMYVIQSGQAEVITSKDGKEVRLAVLGSRDVFGEMAIFQKEVRSATVRAQSDVRALTIDKKIFMKRVHEDPSFVFMILQKMSQRVRNLDGELSKLKTRE